MEVVHNIPSRLHGYNYHEFCRSNAQEFESCLLLIFEITSPFLLQVSFQICMMDIIHELTLSGNGIGCRLGMPSKSVKCKPKKGPRSSSDCQKKDLSDHFPLGVGSACLQSLPHQQNFPFPKRFKTYSCSPLQMLNAFLEYPIFFPEIRTAY